MTDHLPRCRAELREGMARLGVDVTVSTAAPIIVGRYPAEGYTCPHGTEFWIEPTGEQIAQWRRDQIR